MAPTELVHLTHDGNFQLDTEAMVVSCRAFPADEGTTTVEGNIDDDDPGVVTMSVEITFDVTTMHPRGGGQPCDVGTVSMPDRRAYPIAYITDVTIDASTGVVVHRGHVTVPKADASSFMLANDDDCD